MARFTPPVAFLVAALLAAPSALAAQRPALAGEKARVAEAVKRDLSRLAAAQRTHHGRTKLFATDLKELRFTPTSGAEVSIAFGSMNAWAANASHPALSPVKCFVIVSATDPADAPTSQPFCTDVEPGSAASRVAASTGATTTPTTQATPPATQTAAPPTAAPVVRRPAAESIPNRPVATPPSAQTNPAPVSTPATNPPATATPRVSTPPATTASGAGSATTRTNAPRTGTASTTAANRPAGRVDAVRMITRDATSGVVMADRLESVTTTQFTDALATMSREAIAVMDAPPPEVVRDPYESTQEYEARRAAALAEYQRRETEFFRNTRRSFVVTMPVRLVRYDPDREILEFAVDAMRLPATRDGRSQLTLACFTRPAFWCMPDAGMTYDATELWRVPRATARQFDVLRTPMTLTARFTVGGRADTDRALSVSLVDMELQARGQTVQRWPTR